jgi:hypothetical protein
LNKETSKAAPDVGLAAEGLVVADELVGAKGLDSVLVHRPAEPFLAVFVEAIDSHGVHPSFGVDFTSKRLKDLVPSRVPNFHLILTPLMGIPVSGTF